MKLAFSAAANVKAREACEALEKLYGSVSLEEAEALVVLGGDGHMLHRLHKQMEQGSSPPVYGMNLGTTGFLMNEWRAEDLPERIRSAQQTRLHPLEMRAETATGEKRALALNEVSLLRASSQSAHIRIKIDGKERLSRLVSDGVLLATPAGSSAYNFSVHGPIVPLGASLLALTPISAFRPRRWRGALVPHGASVCFEVLEAEKRPVHAYADHQEVKNISAVNIREDKEISLTLLFDESHSLEERILSEQFTD